jgi:hypothetical protein
MALQTPGPEDPELEHRFNDDLLIGDADREDARKLFPGIYHVLDHPELREEFARYDGMANRAKTWVQRLGLAAIGLATLALLSSAIVPTLNAAGYAPRWLLDLSLACEVAGLTGATIAAGGVALASRKRKWLEGRCATEMLRQWHFQLLIRRGREVEASCDAADPKAAQDAFRALRAQWFSPFRNELRGKLDSLVEDLIERPEAGYRWLHEPKTDYTPGGPVVEAVFAAYRQLRFRHQDQYVAYKLQRSTDAPPWLPLKWPATVLQKRTEGLASSCLIGSLFVSLFIVVGYSAGWAGAHSPALPTVIIALMILNVATRAVQDGLAVPEETQRYNDYAGKIHYLLSRFDASNDAHEKLRLMDEMERAALEELKSFLRTHSEARFLV